MNKQTRVRLEAAGFRIGDAEDFLALTDEERHLVELRLAVSRAVRSLREKLGVTQQQLANKLKSSQSRIAKIEAAASDVTLDLSFKALFAAGGKLTDVISRKNRAMQPRTKKGRKQGKVVAANRYHGGRSRKVKT
jgi:ribosome-binding protein aMBF1 (putative translation factor)